MPKYDFLLLELCPHFNQDTLKKFHQYYELLITETKKVNLTTITEEEDVYIKHFYDSLLLLKEVEFEDQSVVDIGTGAGFPGLVLKLAVPSIRLTLVEPTAKRCHFLNKVIETLELKDVTVVNDRAEKYILKCRETFDIVTARAVASLPILLELLVPYAKVGKWIIAMKGNGGEEEVLQAKNAIDKLKIELKQVDTYQLPKEQGIRKVIVFKKKSSTPSLYPRDYAKIKKSPL